MFRFGLASGSVYERAQLDALFQQLAAGISPVVPTGTVGDGLADDTVALQAWLNSGATAKYLPPGNYNFSSLVIPPQTNSIIFGNGPASRLVQRGAGITYTPNGVNNPSLQSTIRDLSFDGTLGTGNTLNTAYTQVLELMDLLYVNVPPGFASLKLDGNPTASVYMHDVRVDGLRIYSTTAGEAGLELGPWSSDSAVVRMIMNGGFTTNYCIKADVNAMSCSIGNSHPYNAKINVVRQLGNNSFFSWDNIIFDNALQDLFYMLTSVENRFTNIAFESIPVGYSGLVFDGSFNNLISASQYILGGASALSCVREANASSGNKVIGGMVDAIGSYTTPFNLTGLGSIAKGFQGYGNLDTLLTLQGAVTSAQGQNTALNLGTNGAQSSLRATAWGITTPCRLYQATVTVDATPAAGQTFTFNVQKNGTTVATGTISNGQFITNIIGNVTFAPGDLVSIQSVFSATSGSASPVYSILLNA